MKFKLTYQSAKQSCPLSQPISWQQLPQGEAYKAALTQAVQPWLKQIPGYQLLKLGALSGEIPCELPLRHQLCIVDSASSEPTKGLDSTLFPPHNNSLLCAQITELPLIERSIDGCLAALNLNFSHDPHQILREICRVLNDDALLFLAFFHPFSQLGLKRKLGAYPLRHFTPWRVLDWLALLHFEVLQYRRLNCATSLSCCAPLAFVVAQKRRYPPNFNLETQTTTLNSFFRPAQAFKISSN